MVNPEHLRLNQENWNKIYTKFAGWCALPAWGVYEIGTDDPSILGTVQGKIFLEMCCGSGHSIQYLVGKGAQKVYALDLSEKQLELARKNNERAIADKKVAFFHSPMEASIELPEKVDMVFSIYGMGWSLDPLATFKHIYNYLKPGGRFVWSWDHSLFSATTIEGDKVVFKKSYFDEELRERKGWKDFDGSSVYMANRKISTWFQYLRDAGFTINRYLEPYPININEDITTICSPEMGKYYAPLKGSTVPSTVIFECIKPLNS
jgi:SAM-dependent methyltransferase